MFESVVFPAPFSPRSAWTSPTAASKSMGSVATTAGNRFVMGRRATAGSRAGDESGEASPPPLSSIRSALRAADDAPDEPVHRVEVLGGHPLALRETQLAILVVQ